MESDRTDTTEEDSGTTKEPAEPKVEVDQEQAHGSTNDEEDPWRGAAKRLYSTVVSFSNADGGYMSPLDTLKSLLGEVARNTDIRSQDDLLKRVQSRTNENSVSERGSDAALASQDTADITDKLADISEEMDETSEVARSALPEAVDMPEVEETSSPELDKASGAQKDEELFGQLVQVGEILSEGDPTALKDFDNILFNELETSRYESAMEYVITRLQEQWDHVLNVLVPQQQLQTLILVSFVHVISVERVLGVVPFVICYTSFLLMMYSTLAMFGSRKWLRQAENWKRLFLVFRRHRNRSGLSDDTGGESLYSWKTTEPYVTYFISLTLFTFSLALTGGDGSVTLPNSWSMCAISGFFSIACFLALADRHDKASLLIMLLDILACSPKIFQKFGVRIGTVPVLGTAVTNWEICHIGLVKLQLGVPSLAFISIMAVYGFMLVSYPRRDLFSTAIPHLVCAAWWHTGLELFVISDVGVFLSPFGWYELALTIGVIWLVTFPTMAAFILIMAIIVAQLRNIIDSVGLVKTTLTGTILLLPFLYWKRRRMAANRNWSMALQGKGRLKSTVLALIVYGLLVFTAMAVLYDSRITGTDGPGRAKPKELTWTRYETHCSYGDENLGNRLEQQIVCSQLGGVKVNWKGTIQGVRIVRIDNLFETVLSYLPMELSSRLRCVYGERINETADTGSVMYGLELGHCTLVARNVYTFEIEVAGPWGQHTLSSAKGTVILVASPHFQELAVEFEQGDVIDFTGSFVSDSLLKYPPKLKLVQLQCIACQHVSKENHGRRFIAATGGALWTRLFDACCFLFNFVFSPLFIID